MRNTIIVVMVSLWATLLLSSCVGQDPETVVTQAAEDWASGSIRGIAADIGANLTGELPLLRNIAASVIEDQIRDKVGWSFSSPVKKAKDRYEVVAKASTTIDINIPFVSENTYDISVDFYLEVDTDRAEVVDSRLNVTSLSIQQRK